MNILHIEKSNVNLCLSYYIKVFFNFSVDNNAKSRYLTIGNSKIWTLSCVSNFRTFWILGAVTKKDYKKSRITREHFKSYRVKKTLIKKVYKWLFKPPLGQKTALKMNEKRKSTIYFSTTVSPPVQA